MTATERDREVARDLVRRAVWAGHPDDHADAIAAALASERERALAPFAEVAADLDRLAARYTRAATGSYDDGIRRASANAADMLRRAAQDGAE